MIDRTDRGNGNDTPFCDMIYRWAVLIEDGYATIHDCPHLSFELDGGMLSDDRWYIQDALPDPDAGYIILPKRYTRVD